MINKRVSFRFLVETLAGIIIMISLSGCHAPRNVAYFQDISEETLVNENPRQITIAPNDKLTITVKTMEPALSSLFNLQVVSDRLGDGEVINTGNGNIKTSSSVGLQKYTVNPEGYIDFPVLGLIKVAGMTRGELAGFIKGELMGKDLAKDPVVTVEFANMNVSVMGEVNYPGRYDINQDQLNVLDAIAMAGDLKIEGRRDNVAVIRNTENGTQTYRLDLTNFRELSQSPAYYLQQNDIIYVEPIDMRKRQTTTNGNNVLNASFWISVASLLTSVVTTIAVFIR